jgi:hypothetical protein
MSLTNSEVPHLWAHRSRSEAKTSNGTLYFSGDTIYSYGSHFPIARHVTQADGTPAVLFTTRSYSVTTSAHTSRVRHAIPASVPKWYVQSPDKDFAGCFANFKSDYRAQLAEVVDAKNKTSRAKRYLKLESTVDEANRFAEAFGIKERLTLPTIEGAAEEIAAVRKREEIEAKRRAAKAKREREKQLAAQRIKYAEDAERWKAGENVYTAYYFPDALLRIEDDEVVTSKGARFPVSHAVRGLRIVERVRATGQPYQRNGHTIHLGHYALDSIDKDGNVHAGCHFVKYEEIQRIAPALLALGVEEK